VDGRACSKKLPGTHAVAIFRCGLHDKIEAVECKSHQVVLAEEGNHNRDDLLLQRLRPQSLPNIRLVMGPGIAGRHLRF